MTTFKALGRRITHLILAAATIATPGACGQTGGSDGLFQTGQIIGGGTKQIAGVQPVGGFLPNPSLLNPGGP